MSHSKSCLAALLLVGCATSSFGTPVQWTEASGGNGHYYDRFVQVTTWPTANAHAMALTFHGIHGTLATITSQAESDFMMADLPTGRYWIGGYQDLTAPDYSEPAGGWRWVTGEPFSYTHWNVGEPNNDTGDERYLSTTGFPDWSWNDEQPNFETGAFFVEYVPEPSSFVLAAVGVGLISIAGLRARRRRII